MLKDKLEGSQSSVSNPFKLSSTIVETMGANVPLRESRDSRGGGHCYEGQSVGKSK